MKDIYFDIILKIERLHRLFLEVLGIELDKLKIYDINNVQSLILYNIGEKRLTVSELTAQGLYLGTNVSYNLQKMSKNDYIQQIQSPHDKRSTIICLTEKGLKLYKIMDNILVNHVQKFDTASFDLNMVTGELRNIENFWHQLIINCR